MKTKQKISAIILLLLGFSATAETPQRTLLFFGTNGIILQMPVMAEEVTDSVPLPISNVFDAYRYELHRPLFEHPFDLKGMMEAEPDADDVIIDTAAVFKQIMEDSDQK